MKVKGHVLAVSKVSDSCYIESMQVPNFHSSSNFVCLRGETTNQLKRLCIYQFSNCGPVQYRYDPLYTLNAEICLG